MKYHQWVNPEHKMHEIDSQSSPAVNIFGKAEERTTTRMSRSGPSSPICWNTVWYCIQKLGGRSALSFGLCTRRYAHSFENALTGFLVYE